jgi:hypothetical protein
MSERRSSLEQEMLRGILATFWRKRTKVIINNIFGGLGNGKDITLLMYSLYLHFFYRNPVICQNAIWRQSAHPLLKTIYTHQFMRISVTCARLARNKVICSQYDTGTECLDRSRCQKLDFCRSAVIPMTGLLRHNRCDKHMPADVASLSVVPNDVFKKR